MAWYLLPMDDSPTGPSFLGRALRGALAGALLGLAVGAIEGCVLLVGVGMGVRSPMAEMLRIDVYYALFCGGIGALVHALFARRCFPNALRWTIGLTVFFLGLMWLRDGLFIGKDAGAGLFLGALGGAAVLAAVVGCTLGRLGRAPAAGLVLALVAAGAAHGVALTATDDGQGADLGIPRWSDERPPNLLVVLIDTLRADRLGCYGYDRPTSPVLDELAAGGTRFDAAYAHASWTRPSVASLMTSLYPSSHDIQKDLDSLPASLPTLAQVLDARGYETAAFSANPQISPVYGFDRGFDTFGKGGSHLVRRTAIGNLEHMAKRVLRIQLLPLLRGGAAAKPKAEKDADGHPLENTGAAAINEQVYRWIDGYTADEPYFLYVQYIDPHTPYAPPVDLINEGGQAPVSMPASFIDKDAPPFPLAESAAATEEVLAGLSRLYDAEVRFVDREVGRLIERLEERGMMENTFVVVTSDHGEEFYDHSQWLHGQSLFDELVRVPLIVAGPGVAAQVVRLPVELVDVLPTAAGWAGAPLGFDHHGRDLGEVLRGGEPDGDRVVYSERQGTYAIDAVRRGDRKLIRITSPEGVTWLEYDLAADPGERNNLAASRAPDAELRALLEQVEVAAGAYLGERSGKIEAEGELAEELGALGYIDTEEDE